MNSPHTEQCSISIFQTYYWTQPTVQCTQDTYKVSPCSQSKHGCFTSRKKVLSLEVLIGIVADTYL